MAAIEYTRAKRRVLDLETVAVCPLLDSQRSTPLRRPSQRSTHPSCFVVEGSLKLIGTLGNCSSSPTFSAADSSTRMSLPHSPRVAV